MPVASIELPINVPARMLADLCDRWKIDVLWFFGSVLRADFRPESDLDVLVRFRLDAPWDAFDLVSLREELSAVFGRPVDLIEEGTVRNPFRRQRIMAERTVIYDRCG